MPATEAPPPAAPPSQTPAEALATPQTDKAPTEYMSDIISELGDLDAGKPLPPRDRDEKGKFKPAEKPAAKAPEKTAEKPAEKPSEKPEEQAKAPEKPEEKTAEAKPVKAAELRTAYEGLKKKVKEELEPEVQRLRSRIQEFESKPAEDTAPIMEKMKALEEKNAALEKHIAYVDYSESSDFKAKYAEPYKQAWDEAISEFGELTVREPDGLDDEDKPKFKLRPATQSDLLQLANMRLSDMDAAAQAMFGPSASRAINHIQNLKKLSAAKTKALEDAQTKAQEWKASQSIQQRNQTEQIAKAWSETNKALEEKFPTAFRVEQSDPDDVASHTKGFALADLLFLGPEALTPEQVEALPSSFKEVARSKKPLTEVQRVQLHALGRLKMANHDRKVAALKKAQSRIAELEKALADYEKSEPAADKAGESARVSDKPWDQVIEDEIRALDRG